MLTVTNIANQRRRRQRQSIEDTSSDFHLRQKIGQEIGIAEIAKQPAAINPTWKTRTVRGIKMQTETVRC
jgi:hypothetical protein